MEKIELDKWREAPCNSEGVGTEEDLKNSIAGFSIPSGSKPYDIQLLLCAVQKDEDTKQRIPCIAIQIEKDDNGVHIVFGFYQAVMVSENQKILNFMRSQMLILAYTSRSWGTA